MSEWHGMIEVHGLVSALGRFASIRTISAGSPLSNSQYEVTGADALIVS
jgi:hypothetical protein